MANKSKARAEKFIERVARNVQDAGMDITKIVEILTSEDGEMDIE